MAGNEGTSRPRITDARARGKAFKSVVIHPAVISVTEFQEHFDGKRFYNPDAPQAPGFIDLLRWKFTSRPEYSPAFIPDVKQSKPPRRVEGSGARITLVNHSTVLIQQKEYNILTDPIWSERASPLRWVGPRRRRQPGVRIGDLPRIDAVLISHNHYDHLDLRTLLELASCGEPAFIVPAGVGRLMRSHNISPFYELDWGQSVSSLGFVVHSVPALHFSARGIRDRNKTLWCGYVIESHGRLVYFSGDTGLGGHFAQIREKFGSPDLALLPIGAYEPRWFMSPVHMSPDEAIRAHQVLAAKISVAIHHGTFQLADDGVDKPKKE